LPLLKEFQPLCHLGEDLKSTVEVLSEIKRHEGQARKEKEVSRENG
jgi:hypothetical protein